MKAASAWSRRDFRRGHHPRPRHLQGLPGAARRSARAGAPGSAPRHRPGQADLHAHRRPAQRRNRSAGNAHGAGLPPGGGRIAALRPDPQERDRDDVVTALEPDGRDRYVDWYYRYKITEETESRPRRRAALLGQVHLPRQQSRHQLLPGDHAQLAEVLPGVASADHARPA